MGFISCLLLGFVKRKQKKYGNIIIGNANFEEIARVRISGIQDGMLKIVCDAKVKKYSAL